MNISKTNIYTCVQANMHIMQLSTCHKEQIIPYYQTKFTQGYRNKRNRTIKLARNLHVAYNFQLEVNDAEHCFQSSNPATYLNGTDLVIFLSFSFSFTNHFIQIGKYSLSLIVYGLNDALSRRLVF